MKYFRNTTDFYIEEDTVISLGKFDGIHRGHEHLMEYLARKKQVGLKTVIFTFDIPPKQRINKQEQSQVLTSNEEKVQLFEAHGIDYLVECPFTSEVMHMEPEVFIEMIVKKLRVKSLVVGTDFHFGHNRRGDYRLLQELASYYGYEVEVAEKLQEDGRDISSSFIREEILAGHIEKANRLLGYQYFVQGKVIHGNEIGRTLNAPTANIVPKEEKVLPPFGVYVTRTTIGKRGVGGITNVGCKPTIEGENPIGIETHLFDFNEQIYGMQIKVEFLTAVRPEKKFDSLEKLKQQMQEDIAYGKKYYANVTKIC